MAVKTTIAQLEEVQAAITKIMEGGQDVMLSDKRILYARLDALSKREQILLDRYNAEQGEGGISRNTVLIRRGWKWPTLPRITDC